MLVADADPVLAVVAALSGSRSAELVRRFEHGAGGTSLVRLDGRTVVLKAWRPDSGIGDIAASLARMRTMRRRGVPIPEVLEQGEAAGCAYLAYGEIDGEWPPQVTPRILDGLLAVVDAERGAADEPCHSWRSELERMLTTGDVSFDIDPSVVEQHQGGRELLTEARTRLAACDLDHVPTNDIVHGDFAPENVLVRADHVVGVIDWERCRTGDAAIDLAGVLFDVELGGKALASVRGRLWREVRSRVAADVLGAYVAIYAVRYASWAIASDIEDDVLALGTRLVDQTST